MTDNDQRPEPTSGTPITMGVEIPRIVFAFLWAVIVFLLLFAGYVAYVGITTGGLP